MIELDENGNLKAANWTPDLSLLTYSSSEKTMDLGSGVYNGVNFASNGGVIIINNVADSLTIFGTDIYDRDILVSNVLLKCATNV